MRTALLLWLCLTPSSEPILALREEDETRLIRVPGDIILGGIFPIHEATKNTTAPCGRVKEEKGIQRVEAMLRAIDEINNSTKLLPNVSLGVLIVDSCSTDTYALEQSMEFMRYYMNQDHTQYRCESGKQPIYEPPKATNMVVGASFSIVSIMIANILRLFKIPQISYASTSTELSDKNRFEYFSRVVPPDNFQAQAMVAIIEDFGWKYISTVAVEGEYGEKGIASFTVFAERAKICIATAAKISRVARQEEFDAIVYALYSKIGARGVVMFVDEDNIRKLLEATVRANITGHFLWIGSDSWGAKVYPVRGQEFIAENAVTILPHRTPIKDFDDYYMSLRPKMDGIECNISEGENIYRLNGNIVNCRNEWFQEFWSQHHECDFAENTSMTHCSGEEIVKGYEQEGLVPFVFDAVYAGATAIHNLIAEECGTEPFHVCEKIKKAIPGQLLLKYVRSLKFVGRQGSEVKFNADGDAYGSYTIYQYQKSSSTGRYDYLPIGSWKESTNDVMQTSRLKLSRRKLRFGNSREIPKSVCSDLCPSGHAKFYQDACCWACLPCKEGSISENQTCVICGEGYTPNKARDFCNKLDITPVTWRNPWILVPLIFSGFGIGATLFTAGVFIKFNSTPVIMASGRELCYVLLIGLAFCYTMPYVILDEPSPVKCGVMRVGVGLCLNICYSAILIKTNRICRIFNSSMRSARQPILTSPISQIIITIMIILFQLGGTFAWLALDRPYVKEVYPNPSMAILTCGVSTTSLLASLGYNMFLILLCTLYAFKTRKIPENFNEAKYIGFTMYSTCIVWVAFLPIYFGSNHDYTIQLVCLSMCIDISATVTLACLFSPKVYLVLFQPYKNVRQPNNVQQIATAAAGTSGTTGQPRYRMRFSTPRPQPPREEIALVTIHASTPSANADSTQPGNEESDCTPSVQETSFN